MSDETVERVARAIHMEQTRLNGWLETPWEQLGELQQSLWKKTAEAAISAYRGDE